MVEVSVLTVSEAGVLAAVWPVSVRVTPLNAVVIVLLGLVAATPAMLYCASCAAVSTV